MNWFPLSFKLLTCVVMVTVCVILCVFYVYVCFVFSKIETAITYSRFDYFLYTEGGLSHRLEDTDCLGEDNEINIMTQFRVIQACV